MPSPLKVEEELGAILRKLLVSLPGMLLVRENGGRNSIGGCPQLSSFTMPNTLMPAASMTCWYVG
jgi:hypothetical protein